MGGKSGGGTRGYKHYLGLHAVFCHGPIDKFTRISVDDRAAWDGAATGGQVTVAAEDLFGGDDREGGVGGLVDFEMGAINQTKNSYLLDKIGSAIPAYRGVAAMVFQDFYWGNNPYLKPVRARGQRIYTAQDGALQWYDAKAAIRSGEPTPAAVDLTSEFPDLTQGIDGSYPVPDSFYPHTITLGPYAQAATLVAGAPDGSGFCRADDYFYFNGVKYGPGDPAATTYAAGTVLFTLPAGDTVLVQIENTFNSHAGVTGAFHIRFAETGVTLDMNPAHIIRECLVNGDWGMGYTDDDVDDASFIAAADTLFDEGMGISLLWEKQAALEEFINEIVRHIDAALFVSRSTGKFTLRLLRADYDVGTIPAFDESNIDKITNPSRPAFGEMVNSVTVQFWNSLTGRDDSVTMQDPAGVQQQGTVINTTIQYQGFTNGTIAAKVAARDHRALSNPFLSCTIYTGNDARALEVGEVIKLSWAKWSIYNMPMRITGFALSEGRSRSVRLTVVEDVFDTPTTSVIAPPSDSWVDPSQPPVAAAATLAGEMPYYEMVQAKGQSAIDTQMATTPDLGFVGVSAVRADNSIHAKMWTDAGAGYTSAGVFDFCPSGLLAADLGKTDITATLIDYIDLDLIVEGTHFQIDDELLRIDAVDPDTGEIEFGRGVLDTVPTDHSAGARAFFWDNYAGADTVEYADGEAVDVKVTPTSGAGVVDIASVTAQTVTLAARAWRPYPPGDLQVNAQSYGAGPYTGVLALTWVGRDRLLQTSGILADHFDGAIGPEAGTTYRVRGYIDDVLDATIEPAVSGGTWTPASSGIARVEVDAKRDGVYSWQAATHEFYYASIGLRLYEDGITRLTEDGGLRILED